MGRQLDTQESALAWAACPKCGSSLSADGSRVSCQQCVQSWELRDGIPRFYDPGYYWGEVPQQEAASLLSEARRLGWRQAVQQDFQNNPAAIYSILQWQSRAAWLPLLGLPENAVALDVGSGYGAITHALANSCAEVYSVEAIPERIEFTRLRMAQERLTNVQLLQASATELPIGENAFDLIVVNGVLEWVGEWDTSTSPKEVQLRFLRKLQRALKPGGALLIGIENRIGYSSFRGGLDHSGLPYTSLMPRWMASFVLRHSKRAHHRSQLNEKREYRTYTYSEWGYRRLLRKSGFSDLSFYAAEPGYNKPTSLVPVQSHALSAHILRMMSEPKLGARRRWPRLTKLYLSRLGLLRPFVPEFVIIATKENSNVPAQ